MKVKKSFVFLEEMPNGSVTIGVDTLFDERLKGNCKSNNSEVSDLVITISVERSKEGKLNVVEKVLLPNHTKALVEELVKKEQLTINIVEAQGGKSLHTYKPKPKGMHIKTKPEKPLED